MHHVYIVQELLAKPSVLYKMSIGLKAIYQNAQMYFASIDSNEQKA